MRRSVSIALLFIFFATPSIAQKQSPTPTEYLYRFKMLKPKINDTLEFENAFIKINFEIGKQFSFKITNKTQSVIEINWQRASFVDTSGQAHQVIHSGVRYIERDKPMSSTIIPPSASVEDIVHPSDYVSYNDGWKTRDLFHNDLRLYYGSVFSVLLPIKIKAQSLDYFFTFKVERYTTDQILALIPKTKTKPFSQPSFKLSQLKQLKITKTEYAELWSFIPNEGILACNSDEELRLYFINGTSIYALNGWAIGSKIGGLTVSPNLNEVVANDKGIPFFMKIASSLCQ